MTFHIPNDGTVVEANQFDNTPLPAGKYLVTIVPTTKDGHAIVKRPFAKTGLNIGITALAIRFRLADQQTGAGRNLFADIPLARKFAPTGQGKFPDGSPCYDFFGFFRALGYDVDAPEGFNLPEDHELLGKYLEVVIGVEPDNKGVDQNVVKFFNAPSESSRNTTPLPKKQEAWAPAGAPGIAGVPATQGWSPTGVAAPSAATLQGAAAVGWTPGGPAAAPAVATPPANQPWAPAAQDVAYAQAQGNPALQAAAAAGGQF